MPPKVDTEAFSGQRQGWKTPRTPWRCTASVYSGNCCWESPWGKQIDGTYAFCVHVLSIYRKIFLRVFIVYRLLVGFLFVLLYSTMCVHVCLVVSTCQSPLMTHLCGEIHSQNLGGRYCLRVFLSFVWFVYVATCFPRALHNT